MSSKKIINCILCESDQEISVVFSKKLNCNNREYLAEVVQCKSCGFVFDNTEIEEKDLSEFISSSYYKSKKIGSDIDNRFKRHFANRAKSHIKLITQNFPFNFPGKALDIGCGAGIFLNNLKQLGWSTFGIEPSDEHYCYAKNILNLNVTN